MLVINVIILFLVLSKRSKDQQIILLFEKELKNLNQSLREEMYLNRNEIKNELDRNFDLFSKGQKEKFQQIDLQQLRLIETTEKKLSEMRETVDEKLQKT